MNRRAAFTLALAAFLAAASSPVSAAPNSGAMFRYGAFSNHDDLRDEILWWAPGPFHVQLEHWDFVHGRDQFRPEFGVHLRDRRRSVTTIQWRHERDDERFWLGTEQVVNARLVARAEVSPIVSRSRTQVVLDAGADLYWGSYSFAGATVIRDPRDGGLWVVPVRARLATEANDWVQFTIAPASRRSLGWAADAKWRWLRLGVERNSRYDFTNLDNTFWSAGIEVPVPALR